MLNWNRYGIALGVLSGVFVTCVAASALDRAEENAPPHRIRLGPGGSAVSVRRCAGPAATPPSRSRAGVTDFPHPRLVGVSPLIAITTSNKRSHEDIDYEHDLEAVFSGNALVPPASLNFVVGILDSGSVIDLAAGSGASRLGLFGSRLTENTVPISGVGGDLDVPISQPLGLFAAGLSAVDHTGFLNLNAMLGHSNVSMVVTPPLDCGTGEVVSAFIGTGFLSFYNSVIRVDTPRHVNVNGQDFSSPDVQIMTQDRALPDFERSIAMELGGLSPVGTSSYYPVLDPEDLITPLIPTMLSLSPLSFPTGGAFFATILLGEGELGPTNPAVQARVLVDTGAQSSILSPGIAASLSLPRDPDFTLDACGVGGLVPDIPGYYIDYVKISALGGAMEFSRAPFVVLDLASPEGGALDGVLGMNFFWNRNVAFEPSLIHTGFLHVSDPIAIPFADFDLDLDVDDFDAFFATACLAGPESLTPSAECDHLDVDDDGDMDLYDFARFQACFSGSVMRADPHCGD